MERAAGKWWARSSIILGFILAWAIGPVWGQDRYPSRPIELVIAFPPGGVTDIAGRIFAEGLSSVLGVPVAPVNKGGASGTLGATTVLKAPKDGYTLLVNTISGMVLAPTVLKDVAYDATKDFAPIALVSTIPDSLIVRAESPYRTVQELVEAARKNPGKLSYATAGKGTDGHFNGEILASVANIKVKHVPFKGGGEIAPAVMGGHVDFGMGASTTFVPLEQGGKLRMLAITGKVRMKAVPKVPTFDGLGITGDFIDNWAGVFVAAGTPKPIVDALASAAERVVRSKEFVDRIEKTGGLIQYVAPADFHAGIQRDKNISAEIARKVGM